MSITQTQTQLRTNVRRTCNIEGTAYTARHPDADINDAIDRALGAFYRLLTQHIPDQRFLSSSTVSITSGTTTYALPATFHLLVSVDLVANGVKTWLTKYEMPERAALSDQNTMHTGTPLEYRLRGANIEYMPTPNSSYTSTLWFVPDAPQAASLPLDTVGRLDDYVIWYASREIATKDEKWPLIATLDGRMARIEADILQAARARDINVGSRVVDAVLYDRFGRMVKR